MGSISMRLPDDLATRLNALADVTGRSKTYLAVQAITDYLERESWQIGEIKKALAEADAGDFVTDEEVAVSDKKWGYSAR